MRTARKISSPLLQGYTEDGDWIAFDHEQQRPVMGSRIVDLGDGRFQIRAGSQDEADRLMRRISERAAKEGMEAARKRAHRAGSSPDPQRVPRAH